MVQLDKPPETEARPARPNKPKPGAKPRGKTDYDAKSGAAARAKPRARKTPDPAPEDTPRHTVKPAQHHVAARTHAPGLHAVHAFTKDMGNTRRSTQPPGVADTRGATSSRPLPYSARSMPHDVIPAEDDDDPHLHVYRGDGNYHEKHQPWEHEKPGVPHWKISRVAPHSPPVNDRTMEPPRPTLRALRRSTTDFARAQRRWAVGEGADGAAAKKRTLF